MLIPLMWEITLVYLNDMRAKFALDQKPLPLSLPQRTKDAQENCFCVLTTIRYKQQKF